jgi:hypothetical protein
MSTTNENPRQDRRRFLKGVAAAGGVAGVASVAGLAGAREESQEPAAETVPTSRGYHETAHIREYYQKARF